MKDKKLQLGCGKDIKEDYVNLDMRKLPGVDVIHDLNKFPYPFEDNEFEEIYMSHVFEHLSNPHRVMEELYRISKPEALIKIMTPYFAHAQAYMWSHIKFFKYDTFARVNEISQFGGGGEIQGFGKKDVLFRKKRLYERSTKIKAFRFLS